MEKYFAASNSALGFYSYYNECFSGVDKLYIIKGGPGTGKSGFMRRCADFAEKKGYYIEYFYCSSDPDSLDGVIIYGEKRVIAIIDGTAPHNYDLVYPGVRDNIINLGDAWDDRILDGSRDEIFRLCECKTQEYRRAYDALRLSGNLLAVMDSYVCRLLKGDKLEAYAHKLSEKLRISGNGEVKIRLVDSLSMKGRVRFDTFENMASRCTLVGDAYNTGHIMLEHIKGRLDLCGCDYYVSYDPITPKRINGIFERSSKTAFLLSDLRVNLPKEENRIDYINMRRFISPVSSEIKSDLKYTLSLYKDSVYLAEKHLSRAGKHHFALEEIYKGAMDFEIVNKKIEEFCNKVL